MIHFVFGLHVVEMSISFIRKYVRKSPWTILCGLRHLEPNGVALNTNMQRKDRMERSDTTC